MTWEQLIWKTVVALLVAAVLGLAGAFLRLWKGFNPSRQERHAKTMGEHTQALTEHHGQLARLEDDRRANRGLSERVGCLEVEVGHVKVDTGEMKVDLKEVLRLVRANGGGARS